MINFSHLESTVMRDEGFEPRPYLDTVGVPTIGFGTTRIHGEPVTMDNPAMTVQTARELLRSDLYRSLIDAQALFSRFNEMNGVRQAVLANMAYNLGRSRLAGFVKLIRAGENLSYPRMADEMEASKWHNQVGYRAKRLVREMRDGVV